MFASVIFRIRRSIRSICIMFCCISSRARLLVNPRYAPVLMSALFVFICAGVMILYPFRIYARPYGRRVSWMADMCILCLCSSCITSSRPVEEIQLSGFTAMIDRGRYPGFLFAVADLSHSWKLAFDHFCRVRCRSNPMVVRRHSFWPR